MKILFGHHGLRGDLAINLPAIEAVAKANPGMLIDLPINKQFADMAPLFLNHPYINSVLITDEYEKFPSDKDKEVLFKRKYNHVLNPMARHKKDDWWRIMHQTAAVLYDYSENDETLTPDQQQINLVKWFDVEKQEKTVCFAPFAGHAYNKNNDKMLKIEKANIIAEYLADKGYRIIHLGGPGEPCLDWVSCVQPKSYFDSVKCMLGSDLLIHADTGMGWIASGYQHKQLGLYGHRYYGKDCVKNIQPVNPNAAYLDAEMVNDIPNGEIFAAIDKLLS